jgi:leucyl/phenylalanyl-tRNA--protein transferase
MPIFILNKENIFPPVHLAEPDGLLAAGGELSPERLLVAYRNGIFPWYEGEHILWWCPDPRFVLYPGDLKVSKSMKQLFRKNTYHVTFNQAFPEVIAQCKTVSRRGQDGTWISDEMKKAYIEMHRLGYAMSVEAWKGDQLAGGLYGIRLGHVFFGESMFSNQSNASKYAFISCVEKLKSEQVQLIDCQVYTEHLESLGARMISRSLFLEELKKLVR